MNAYIALEKYIVKEEMDFGVGVPVTLDETVAMHESRRKKEVMSYNNWLLINIPGKELFLDVEKSIKEQSDDVLNTLMNRDFICSLFVHEARILLKKLEQNLSGSSSFRTESTSALSDFVHEKYELILNLRSGRDLFNFVNSKCITHDKSKSSALLYSHGIKGCSYDNDTGKRFLLFNAKKDIEPLEFRDAVLQDSIFIT
ncbi:MAG: hypothetical protein J5527_09415 [Treponema sp.]|nr:hypothetical protein [Treponema sp.]